MCLLLQIMSGLKLSSKWVCMASSGISVVWEAIFIRARSFMYSHAKSTTALFVPPFTFRLRKSSIIRVITDEYA